MPTSPIVPNSFAVRVPNPQRMTVCKEIVAGVFEFRELVNEWYHWMFTQVLDGNGNPVAVFSDDFRTMLCEAAPTTTTTTGTGTTTTTTLSTTSTTSTTTVQTINIVIVDNAVAVPYPSTRYVGTAGATIANVVLQFVGLTHTAPGDIAALLVGPTGVAVMLMCSCGGLHPVSAINLTFDSAAGSSLPQFTAISAGTYKPTQFPPLPTPMPAPAPGGPYSVNLADFNGTDPQGTWSLYVIDDKALDVGNLANWNLIITPV